MVKVYSIDGFTPVVHPDAYVHPSAVLIGDVHAGAGVYIGPSAGPLTLFFRSGERICHTKTSWLKPAAASA